MLSFVTKKAYWSALDAKDTAQPAEQGPPPGRLQRLRQRLTRPATMPWQLKSVQDAIAAHHLRDCSGLTIAEIGGGNSRVLASLSQRNRCVNIDAFQGAGNGPTQTRSIRGVRNVFVNVGDFSEQLQDGQFDVLFSVSVVEHVQNLKEFFADSHRLLKSGGRIIHLIDVYLEDAEAGNAQATQRVRQYREAINSELFRPTDPDNLTSEQPLRFSTAYASNPDNIMYSWNQVVPELAERRARAQCCSLLMMAERCD